MSDGGGRDDGGGECEQLECGCSNTGNDGCEKTSI